MDARDRYYRQTDRQTDKRTNKQTDVSLSVSLCLRWSFALTRSHFCSPDDSPTKHLAVSQFADCRNRSLATQFAVTSKMCRRIDWPWVGASWHHRRTQTGQTIIQITQRTKMSLIETSSPDQINTRVYSASDLRGSMSIRLTCAAHTADVAIHRWRWVRLCMRSITAAALC